MVQSVLDICNMALDYCNIRNITALDEKTKEAKKCNAWYDIVRRDLLLNLNASFSIKRAVLAEYTDYVPCGSRGGSGSGELSLKPNNGDVGRSPSGAKDGVGAYGGVGKSDRSTTDFFGYGKAYVLPRDLLQVLNLGSPLDDNLYQIEGQYFYCNESIKQVSIRYIADITDVTKFDSSFCDCLALKLAEKICLPLTEDEQKTQFIRQLAQQKYIETSTKYGRDNRMIVINKPRYRNSKIFSESSNFNYPIR